MAQKEPFKKIDHKYPNFDVEVGQKILMPRGPFFKSKVWYQLIASLCVQIVELSLNISNSINTRNRISLVRKYENRNQNS